MALPNLLNVQGKLSNINDEPLVGEYTFMFRIYNAGTGGLPLWTETKMLNTTSQGLFSTLLGSITPLTLNFSENYFVEVNVNGETLIPRYTVGSTSYSFKTNMTDFVSSGGIALGNFIVTNNLTVGGNNLFVDNNTNRVGIGTTTPLSTLHINTSSSNAFIIQNTTGTNFFFVNGTNGRIGIGTTNPRYLLDIAGIISGQMDAINITGDLSIWNNKIKLDVNNITGDFSAWANKTQLNAANITAGTFGAGSFIFPENLVVTRNLTVSNNILFVNNLTGRVGIRTLTPQSTMEIIGNLNVTGLVYILNTPTAATSNGTIILGKTSDGWENITFDTTLGSNGKFLFSAPLQVAASSPAITFYDPAQPDNTSRQKSLIYNATATYPISFGTGVEINGSLSVLGASPATITFGSGSTSQTLQFDPSSQEFKFSGGKIKQDFANLIKNGGFESFSGGASGGTATIQNFYGGEYQGITPDGWEAPINATTSQFAPSSYSIGSDIYQGYNSLRLYPLSGLGKIRQTLYSYQLQPNKTYSVGVWVKTFNTASTAKLGVTGPALLNDFTEQTTTTNSSWTQLKGQFTTKSMLTSSDSISIELIADGSSSYPVLFDAAQLNMGNVLGEYQDAPIVGVGDQTIYGGLRLQRTGYGRGGVLSVDTAVRTRK
ncbi:carbohydrate binding domain-containing protein, partial [archaeon]|nr:carbohydrate binding domain-containing protein [archaeon]